MKLISPAIGLVLLAVAGCVSPAAGPAPDVAPAGAIAADWWTHAIPSVLEDREHDHGDRAQHLARSTANFQVLGWDPLVTQAYGTSLIGMGCGGAVAREDGRTLAVVHSISTDVSFVVADVTDPTAPEMLGEFYMPNAIVWDADISADGKHVLVGAYPWMLFGEAIPKLPGEGAALPPLTIQFRSACTGDLREVGPVNYLPFGPGIVMVGIEDPANPVFEDWVSQPAIGPHSVGSQLVDGALYATTSVTNFGQEISYYTIFEIVGPKLVPSSVIQAPGHPGIPFVNWANGHTDIFLQKHPATGQLLAHLANWDGYYIVDLSIPAVPRVVSSWFDAGSVHTTYPFPALVGDKQYVIVGQEVNEYEIDDQPSGWIYILDVTDPAAPTEVGRWTLPVKFPWKNEEELDGGLTFSPHYVAILDQTLFVSNYHGGLWAVDISDPTTPTAIGIFVPENESSAPFDGAETYGPSIEDVVADPASGVLTTWDGAGGVYLLRFDEAMPKVHAPGWKAPGAG